MEKIFTEDVFFLYLLYFILFLPFLYEILMHHDLLEKHPLDQNLGKNISQLEHFNEKKIKRYQKLA